MNFDAIARFAAEGILNSFLMGIAIALLGWVVTRLFDRQGSGTRFVVWSFALIAIGLLPFAGHFARASHAGARMSATSAITLPGSVATYLFVAWITGTSLGLLHIAHGLYRLHHLRATCTPVSLDQLDANSCSILDDIQTYRHVTLCTSDAVRVPAAIGYFRPMVVFPAWALSEIPPAELNGILLHELEHLRRWDDFSNLAQKIVKAVFFFHPAVWFIESRLTLEREMACDDAVLAASVSPRAYAESLVGLAEKSFLRRGVQLAQAAVSHVQQLKLRLAEILRKDRSQRGSTRVWKPAVALISLVGIVSSYGVAHAPRLIAFSSDAVQLASRSNDNSVAPTAAASPVELAFRPMSSPSLVNSSEQASVRDDRSPAATPFPGKAESSGSIATMSRHKVPDSARCPYQPALQSRSDGDVVVASGASRWNARANELQPAERPTPAPILVVFQARQFGADGPIFWRVTIVHLTPEQHRTIAGGIAKQI